MNLSRRSLLIAAPAIILTPHLLMPIKPWMRRFRTNGEILWECVNISEDKWVELIWQGKRYEPIQT